MPRARETPLGTEETAQDIASNRAVQRKNAARTLPGQSGTPPPSGPQPKATRPATARALGSPWMTMGSCNRPVRSNGPSDGPAGERGRRLFLTYGAGAVPARPVPSVVEGSGIFSVVDIETAERHNAAMNVPPGQRKICRRCDRPGHAYDLTFSCFRREPFFRSRHGAGWWITRNNGRGRVGGRGTAASGNRVPLTATSVRRFEEACLTEKAWHPATLIHAQQISGYNLKGTNCARVRGGCNKWSELADIYGHVK